MKKNKYSHKIVVIGGGTGLPVVLNGLKNEDCDITAIVTVADDGGSSGDLRESMHMAPPGDLRNVLNSLSTWPQIYKDIFQYRFDKNTRNLSEHTIGNLIIAAMTDMRGNIYDAVQELSDIMWVEGNVYPVSEESMTLHATFYDGTEAIGETNITNQRKMIRYIDVMSSIDGGKPKVSRHVVEAILEADMIVLGPGSLFTSILPNLMIDAVRQAILQTKAHKVYICNIMTQKGETENFSDADHIRVLHQHLKQPFIDTVLVNIEPVPENRVDENHYDEYLVQVSHDFQGLREENCRVISDNFLDFHDGGVFHNSDKVVSELMYLLSDSFKHREE